MNLQQRSISFFCQSLGLVLLLVSCTANPVGENYTGRALPGINGSAGEVLVVMDNDLWKSTAGDDLRESLEKDYPALPQPEPLLDIVHISPDALNELFRLHRSVIITGISPSGKDKVTFSRNTWAKPQLVINITAASEGSLLSLIKINSEKIVSEILEYDRFRMAQAYNSGENSNIKTLLSRFGIRLAVPAGYSIDASFPDFVSLSSESGETSQIIFIFSFPYTGQNDLSAGNLIKKRDEFLKKYTKGYREGIFMQTSPLFSPVSDNLVRDGLKIKELRGLWELNEGYMGGPFISHSTVDTVKNMIITVDANIYRPNNKKRYLMRQMEAIVYSMELSAKTGDN
jgi:hypothetical protein